MSKYPGLGLPLREGMLRERGALFYPIGAHHDCPYSTSDPLPVRELAMMSIMDKLTDKEDWHRKVFDENIVAKWREEARNIPDEHFWDLAEAESDLRKHAHPSENPARILNDESFEYVS